MLQQEAAEDFVVKFDRKRMIAHAGNLNVISTLKIQLMLKTVRQDVQIRNKLKTTARALAQNGGHATKPCTKKYRKIENL